jgi:cytochrome b subunit of formate dehydrogenase
VQFVFLIFSKRAREQFTALLPRKQDISDAVHMFRYNLGAEKYPPHFSRFNFIEKFEYWALVWGSIIMGITGLCLWFKDAVLSFSPEWVIDLFLVIHFYEALLATLSILIWHFYWTIFNPHVYPMDTIWIDGKISEERLKEEHPAEWEEITREQEQQGTTEGDM